MISYEEGMLLQTLRSLDARLRAAFAGSCAERHLALYDEWHRASGKGNPEALATAMEHFWGDLMEERPGTSLNDDMARVMAAIPREDEAEEWSAEHARAEDVAAAVAYALRARISGDAQEAVWAARCCYELADREAVRLLAEPEAVSYPNEAVIAAHPRVQHELRLQEEALRRLQGIPFDVAVVQDLKAWSVNNRRVS